MSGLTYRKLDLHVHTPASACYLDKSHTANQIISTAIEKGMDGIAITDHNTAEWIDNIQTAAKGKDLVIFPGVEISLEAGFHLVAIFDPSKNQKHVEGLLAALKISPEQFGKSDSFCKLSPHEAIELIHEWKGLAILPHIDLPKGAFYEQTTRHEKEKIKVPATCYGFFNEAKYDAVECSKGKFPEGFDEGHHIERFPAFYQASDNPDASQPTKHSCEGIGALYTCFKLDQIDIEGLRQCFADPEVRIRLFEEYKTQGYPNIVEMKILGDGFLGGQTLQFHKGLNSIIGGKGVGKSLAIEFIRFALGQPPSDENILKDHLGKLSNRLGPENSVEIIYEQDDGSRYQIRRTINNFSRDGNLEASESYRLIDTGEEINVDPKSTFPVLAYSQTEIISIANDKNAQLRLIDRFLDARPHELAISNIQQQLSDNDKNLVDAIRADFRLKDVQKEIDTLSGQIKVINKSLDNPLFEKIKKAESINEFLINKSSYLDRLIDQVEESRKILESEDEDEISDLLSKEPNVTQAKKIAENAKKNMLKSFDKIIGDLKINREEINSLISTYKPDFEIIQSEYKELLKSIGGDREDKERERKQLEKQKSRLESEANSLRTITKDLQKIIKTREEELNQLEYQSRIYFETRQAKYQQLSELSDQKLKLEISHASDLSRYEEELINLLKGGNNLVSVSDRKKIAQNILPRRFVDLVLNRNIAHIANEAGISESCAQRVVEKLWSGEDFAEMLAIQHSCYPGDTPSIKYQKSHNVYSGLDEISIGQKCTALLIIALCDGKMPVIIDQPEDALDIATVWEDVTKKLRRGKDSRQFILTTHNSSVAVGGDSDQIFVLEAGADTGEVVHEGAIDREDVRQSVIAHMEGGKEPYQLRAHKYNMKQ